MFLSLIIPAYNEEKKIPATLENISKFLAQKEYTYEIIVVNDGSADNTHKVTEYFASTNKNVSILDNSKNEGKGASLKKGILASKGEYILFMDADYSTPIEEIDNMLSLLTQDSRYDFLIGSRYAEGANILRNEPLFRILLGRIYHYLVKVLLLGGIRDYNCGFKLYRKNVAKDLFPRLNCKGYAFDAELLYLAKHLSYRYKEMPITWKHNPDSKVKPFIDGVKTFFSLIRIKIDYYRGCYGIDATPR